MSFHPLPLCLPRVFWLSAPASHSAVRFTGVSDNNFSHGILSFLVGQIDQSLTAFTTRIKNAGQNTPPCLIVYSVLSPCSENKHASLLTCVCFLGWLQACSLLLSPADCATNAVSAVARRKSLNSSEPLVSNQGKLDFVYGSPERVSTPLAPSVVFEDQA